MPLDHSDFIKKYHTPPDQAAITHKRIRKILISTLILIVYVVGCVILAAVLGIDQSTMLAAALLFLLAAFVGFTVQDFLGRQADKEKERLVIREVLEGSRGARLITDGADNTFFANQRFFELCGKKSLPGLPALAALFEDNAEAFNHFRLLSEQAHRGLTDSIELRTGHEERERWFLVTAQPIAGWAGYVHWRVDDITRQRDLDRSVREEREKLIDFTDNAPVGFYSTDETGRFVFVNATLARWLGTDIQTLLSDGRLHTYMVTPPMGALPHDITEKGGVRQVAEITMKGPYGTSFQAQISQAVHQEAEGLVRTRGVVHDLTSEREMRRALEASEDRFQRFFEEAPLGIVLIDSAGKIKDCNVELAEMLGQTIEQIEGKSFRDIMSEDDRDTVFMAMSRIGQGEQMSAPMEITLRGHKDVSVQMHARRFKGSDHIVLHFIDLTDQKLLEAQFIQSQKMQAVGQLAGGVAHDFNNLLTAIIGFCDLLLLRHKPGDPSFGDIMQVKQNSNRAANLVRQLLAFSRQQTLRPKVQDMTDILVEVSHLIRRLIGANIELDLVHGQSLGLVKVDVGQMEQVLVNLAVNARDAIGDKGGKLTIATSNFENDKPLKRASESMPPGAWVKIEFSDTGCGIPEENMVRIFEPFFTTKDVGQGTGLGLATVFGIIRQTGGYVHVESTVNVGTTFSIYLPRLSESEIKESAEDRKQEDEPQGDLTGTARILLVEDEDAVRTFSTRALTNKGYEVLSAESGEAGLSLMEQSEGKKIDLLITDVMMPGMDGPTMAKQIRARYPDLKIIFISGYTEDKLKDHMGDNIFFLPKPFTLKQLAAKVKEVMG
ncbi:MAG: PAS domain S-box protein [Alphaproteobacteria bacterium]|nr:PAS domain S-box protein [Alphaproteobacteria bacterium]